MANLDLLNPLIRKQVLEDIRSQENIARKAQSLADYEIYNDRIKPYVVHDLTYQLGAKTVAQMPIVSTLNIGKMIVKEEAKVYTTEPTRTITTTNEKDILSTEMLYQDQQFDSKLQKANIWFKYRQQSFLQVVLKESALDLRVLQAHHIDVIPDETNPENAYAYIISSFDKSAWYRTSDGVNQKIADPDDYKASLERYAVWTADHNFIMDGKGVILGEPLPNEIAELPFVEVCKEKDFEFFVRLGEALSEFTIQYNAAWSDAMYINRMQGFSVGVLKGDASLMPETMTVGPAKILFLPTDPNNPNSNLDLSFENPSPNLEASLKVINDLLGTFLVTRGLDPSKVSASNGGAKTYGSAIERLLAMIDDFDASKEDFALFQMVEKKLFNIIKKYLVLYTGTPLMDQKYAVSSSFGAATMQVVFHKPEMIETTSENLANQSLKLQLGITDREQILSEVEGITIEEATKRIQDLDARKANQIMSAVPKGVTSVDQGA